MMNKVINVAYWASMGYLVYCAIDRVAMKAEKEGYAKGFNEGVSLGKIQAYSEVTVRTLQNTNEPKEQDQESK